MYSLVKFIDTSSIIFYLLQILKVKKKEEVKKGPGAKDDKGEKKGKEDEEDLGYRLTTSEFVKALKAADKTYIGKIDFFFFKYLVQSGIRKTTYDHYSSMGA
jgi:hypothetical protein